jgi:hypothetical protein
VTRVFLNLCSNGFANKRRKEGGEVDFRPMLKVMTRELGDESRCASVTTALECRQLSGKLSQPSLL